MDSLAIMMMEWWPLAPKTGAELGHKLGGTSDSSSGGRNFVAVQLANAVMTQSAGIFYSFLPTGTVPRQPERYRYNLPFSPSAEPPQARAMRARTGHFLLQGKGSRYRSR